ncbi:alpha/beta-Hydrolases protein [Dioscorea alata]|uniref:Alpha/beta-Hydrolases protein n=2 Tax=Dioscorea alata TaxID=55571 RepID=A0ACB7TV23_DIOAL|nr:alpha/beta-Hydrolases protein [Dioscorea alata]
MEEICSAEKLSSAAYNVQSEFLSEACGTVFVEVMDFSLVHILNLTSYVSRSFIRFIENLMFRDAEKHSQYSNVSPSQCYGRHFQTIYQAAVDCPMLSKSSYTRASLLEHERELQSQKENFFVNKISHILPIETTRVFIRQGVALSFHFLNLGRRLTSACWRTSCAYFKCICTQVQGFLSRVRRTLQGSSHDIGWLQRTEGLPPTEDGTIRFMELLHDIRNGEHCLPNTLIYLLIPGLFSNHSPLYFVNTKKFFSKMGLACHIAKIHSESSVEKNAWELKQYIEELYWGSGKRVLLLGHSKGGVDAAAALSLYWADLKDKVAGLALVQSPYGGSPIASDILREGQVADKEARRIMEFIICKLIKGDMRALEDLTYEKRKDFIEKHSLPADQLPLISFHTEASTAPGVLATMSHIAHAELPWLPLPQFCSEAEVESGRRVPVVIPIAAAMAVSALHLWLRYGEASDGLVTRCDAEVPGSVVVKPDRKLDHAWMVCSSLRKDRSEADASEMCEALLTMLVERWKMKQA